ncbi:MFS transporter [Rhizobium sp. BK251]|uniref:MFS transporter n=1 Tax=Rhizobium sp. BK251 TaxID=2512125 RepID=UPI00104BF694|nr:MFS transporter [Rhizobium sp. BK251]TCL64698.1 putative MFS transporter [Rhizobium sp. BK251]
MVNADIPANWPSIEPQHGVVQVGKLEHRKLSPVNSDHSNSEITGLQFLVMAVCSLGLSIDLAEVALGSVLSTVMAAPPNAIGSEQLTLLLAAAYVGAIVGAPLFGSLGDVYGRRTMLIAAMLIMAITSLAAGLPQGITHLTILRAVSGLALGAYPPLLFVYLSEILPPARRGTMLMIVIAFANLSPPLVLVAVAWLTPLAPLGIAGWRWAFVVVGIAAAICALMFCLIPESPRWLLQKGKADQLGKIPLMLQGSQASLRLSKEIDASQPLAIQTSAINHEHRRRLVFVLVALFLPAWAIFGFPLLAGPALLQKGVNVKDSLLYVGGSSIAPIAGTIIGSIMIDRYDRRATIVASATVMAIVSMLFAVAQSPFWLVASATVVVLASSLLLPVLLLYAAELFETERRASSVSWGWASSRVSSALMPIALVPILLSNGAIATFSITSAMLLVFVFILLVFGPR